MKSTASIHLNDVQAVYSGPEGALWERLMGEQIHIGGFTSSVDLAAKAGIQAGMHGVDFCCCNGAGMRFLVRFCEAASVTGVDATPAVIEQCRERCRNEPLAGKVSCILADVCDSGLPSAAFDFIWGEDAWCYVEDKALLISEAVRLVKPGGVIAFTDWVEGPAGLTEAEGQRLLTFMKFPNIYDMDGYRKQLQANGCEIVHAEDTGRFAPYVDLYLEMVGKQLTYDVLKILRFNEGLLNTIAEEMTFMQRLAHAGKIMQGLFIARKK